jgi:hypothetical protein
MADGDERHHHESGGASDLHGVIIYQRMTVTPPDGIVTLRRQLAR